MISINGVKLYSLEKKFNGNIEFDMDKAKNFEIPLAYEERLLYALDTTRFTPK